MLLFVFVSNKIATKCERMGLRFGALFIWIEIAKDGGCRGRKRVAHDLSSSLGFGGGDGGYLLSGSESSSSLSSMVFWLSCSMSRVVDCNLGTM